MEQLLTTAECRTLYQTDITHSEVLLNSFRNPDIPLSHEVQQVRWVLVSDIIRYRGKKYYNKTQSSGKMVHNRERQWYEVDTKTKEATEAQDTHHDRMLMFIDFLMEHEEATVGWCVVSFKQRFGEMDSKRQLSSKGVGYSVDYVYGGELDDIFPTIDYGVYVVPPSTIERPSQVLFAQHISRLRRYIKQMGVSLTDMQFVEMALEYEQRVYQRTMTEKTKLKFLKKYVDFMEMEAVIGARSLDALLHI